MFRTKKKSLKRKHPKIDKYFVKKSNVAPYGRDSERKKTLDKALAKLVIRDLQPLSLVENEGFRDFVKELDPRYLLPCRRTLRDKLINGAYEKTLQNVSNIIGNARYDNDVPHLNAQETKLIPGIVQALQPFVSMTQELSGENYVTVSRIIPLVKEYILEAEEFDRNANGMESLVITDFRSKLLKGVKDRLLTYESKDIVAYVYIFSKITRNGNGKKIVIKYIFYSCSTVLDPRFKEGGFYRPSQYEKAASKIKQKLRRMMYETTNQEEPQTDRTDEDHTEPAELPKKSIHFFKLYK